MKTNEEICAQIEEIFEQLNIKCEKKGSLTNSRDFYYGITFKPTGKLKFINELQVAIYLDLSDNSLTLFGFNIYKFEEDDDITPYYKIVNYANGKQFVGRFVVAEDISGIAYDNCLLCGHEYELLTKELIQNMLEWYEDALDTLFRKIYDYTREEK